MENDKNKIVEFQLTEADVVDKADFGHYEILITKKGAMFKTHTGYHVWTTPYAANEKGEAVEMSLYKWLVEAVKLKHTIDGHEKELLVENGEQTKGDLLDGVSITTEANIMFPMTAFVDRDRAMEFAKNQMDWITAKLKELETAMNTTPPEEDVKADTEFNAKVEMAEQVQEMAKEALENDRGKNG